MTSKFLDYTGLSYLWSKIKEWCSSIFVTKATDEDITGTKTFLGSKKIAFKQSGANDKLGFTLYNNSSKEQGYLEYNPTNKVANVPLFTLGNYATAANELTYIGFRRYSNISGASGAYNLLAPLISDAKTLFNLTTTYTNFYLPLGISDGTNIVTASNSGVIDISSLFPTTYASSAINLLTGYTKPSIGSALTATDTLNQALGKLEAKVDAAVANSDGIPVGSVVWLSTSTVPTGFLLCNGQAVGRDTYPDLFSAIGTTYGEGDGSTTFNLPNLIDKFIEGTNTNVGISVAAGLPEIAGNINPASVFNNAGTSFKSVYVDNPTGAFSAIASAPRWSVTQAGTTSKDMAYGIQFNASKSNSIYGNSDTVQPSAVKLLPCIKAYNSVSNLDELDAAQLENELHNNYVHKFNDEIIEGHKSFFGNAGGVVSINHDTMVSGTIPDSTQYIGLFFCDKNGNTYPDNTIGIVESSADSNGDVSTYLRAVKKDNDNYYAPTMGITYYTNSNRGAAWCPTYLYDRDNDIIATTKWVRRYNRIACGYGNNITTPYRLIATSGVRVTSSYNDWGITLLVDRPYAYGNYGSGICIVTFRTNSVSNNEDAYGHLRWIARGGNIGDCIRVGIIKTSGNSACDIYFHNTTDYLGAFITVLSQSGNRYNNPNAYYPAGQGFQTFCGEEGESEHYYATMNDGAQDLWGENYTDIIESAPYISDIGGKVDGTITMNSCYVNGGRIGLRNVNCDKGTAPSSQLYWSLYCVDKNGWEYSNSIAIVEATLQTNNISGIYFRALQNTSGSTASTTLGLWYSKGSSNTTYVSCGTLHPSSGATCGTSSNKWSSVWASNGTIQTSDERVKTSINNIPDIILDIWENIQWKQFKMKDAVKEKGDNARYHTGIIAQQIQKEFESNDIDVTRYGFFCWDEWGDSDAILASDGSVVVEAIKANEQYSVRYEEALCIEAAYQRRKNKILENRISDLEKQVSNMLQILQSLKGAN